MSGHWAPAAYAAVGKECSYFSFETKIVNAKEIMLLFIFSWLHARIDLFATWWHSLLKLKVWSDTEDTLFWKGEFPAPHSEPINRSIYRPYWGLESVLSQVEIFLERAMGALCYPPTRKVVWTVPVCTLGTLKSYDGCCNEGVTIKCNFALG